MRKLFFILMTVILIVGIFFAQSYRINPLLNKKLDYYSTNTDVTVAIDSAATAGYLGAASSDGVLRTGVSLSYTDGGDFVTINAIQDIRTSAGPTFESLQLNDDTTVTYDLILDSDSDGTALTADRTITFDVNNANRVIDLSGDLTLSGANKVADWEVTGNLQNSGAALTIQDGADQDVNIFGSASVGENPVFEINGWDTAAASAKWGRQYISTAGSYTMETVESLDIAIPSGFYAFFNYAGSSVIAIRDFFKVYDDTLMLAGSGDDSAIEYDENGDDTFAFSLPAGGMSFRTVYTDTDNCLLIKVDKQEEDHSDSTMLDAAATTDTKVVWQQPANSVLKSIKIVLDEQFAASGLSNLQIEIGIAGDDDNGFVIAAGNMTSDAVGTEYSTRGAYWSATTAGSYHNASAQDITAKVTATGANLNTLTAGTVTFYWCYEKF